MTAFRDTLAGAGGLLRIAQLLLVLRQLAFCIDSFRQRRGWTVRGLGILHFFLGFNLFHLSLDLTFVPSWQGEGKPQIIGPAAADVLGDAPWLVLLLAEGISLALLFVCFRNARRHRRQQLLPTAIKETVDLLPAGVCFSEPDGRVRLSNLRMNEYGRQLTGKNLSDAGLLWERVRAGEEQNGRYLVRTGDGKALLFARSRVEKGGRETVQITAADITELAGIRKELQERNQKLRDVQYRMKAYQVRAADMFVEKERLNARIAVHDGLGSLLLHCRYYFENPAAVEEKTLLEMIRRTNRYLLREAEEPSENREPVRDALRMAKGIGVAVTLDAELPREACLRELLGQAIGECAANTVKHAGGDELVVHGGPMASARRFCATITNNGSAPEQPVVETGGLRSLRHKVEEAGGRMEITSEPEFRLLLELPMEQEC